MAEPDSLEIVLAAAQMVADQTGNSALLDAIAQIKEDAQVVAAEAEVGEAEMVSIGYLVTMTRYMADHDYTPDQIAYAVEKPHKHLDVLQEAMTDEEFQMIALRLRDEGVGTDE